MLRPLTMFMRFSASRKTGSSKAMPKTKKSFKEMVQNISKRRNQAKDIKDMSFPEVIEHMHGRPCYKNIKKYREELVDLRV